MLISGCVMCLTESVMILWTTCQTMRMMVGMQQVRKVSVAMGMIAVAMVSALLMLPGACRTVPVVRELFFEVAVMVLLQNNNEFLSHYLF